MTVHDPHPPWPHPSLVPGSSTGCVKDFSMTLHYADFTVDKMVARYLQGALTRLFDIYLVLYYSIRRRSKENSKRIHDLRK